MAVGGSLTAVGAAYLDEHAFAAGARGGSDDLARGCGVDVLRREVDDAAERHERRPVNGTYQGGKPYKKVWQIPFIRAAQVRALDVRSFSSSSSSSSKAASQTVRSEDRTTAAADTQASFC